VRLKGYGWIMGFMTVSMNGDIEFWATSNIEMSLEQGEFHA